MSIRTSEKPMYCITHESWGRYLCDDIAGVPCIWVHSAPPELPENWIELVTEPDAEELSVMDENAEQLLLELTGTS